MKQKENKGRIKMKYSKKPASKILDFKNLQG